MQLYNNDILEDVETRYCKLPDGRIIDIRPWKEGKSAIDIATGHPPGVSVGAILDSKPLTASEIADLIDAGILP